MHNPFKTKETDSNETIESLLHIKPCEINYDANESTIAIKNIDEIVCLLDSNKSAARQIKQNPEIVRNLSCELVETILNHPDLSIECVFNNGNSPYIRIEYIPTAPYVAILEVSNDNNGKTKQIIHADTVDELVDQIPSVILGNDDFKKLPIRAISESQSDVRCNIEHQAKNKAQSSYSFRWYGSMNLSIAVAVRWDIVQVNQTETKS